MKSNAWAVLCIALVPYTRLLHLYQANADALLLLHVCLAGLILSALLLGEYLFLLLLTKNHFSAVLICLETYALLLTEPLWFELSVRISSFLHSVHTLAGLALLAIPCLLLAFLLARLGKKLPGEANAFLFFLTVFLLVMNLVPSISLQLQKNKNAIPFKTEFTLSENAKSPNIYWFHLDGMLGADTVEKYFGTPAEPYDQALTQRGFTLFPGASLEANHSTVVAIPALTCPDYYDRVLKGIIEGAPLDHRSAIPYAKANPLELLETAYQNETLTAFMRQGYATRLLGLYAGSSYLGPFTKYYAVAEHNTVSNVRATRYPFVVEESRFDNYRLRENLISLMGLLLDEKNAQRLCDWLVPLADRHAPLTHLPDKAFVEAQLLGHEKGYFYYSSLIQSLYDELHTATSPRFTLIHSMIPHCPYIFSVDGGLPYPDDEFDVRNYPKHFEYAFQVTMNMVDMVLKADPSAIIVLAGDHGIHSAFCVDQLAELYGEAGRVELWNNIFYAVRLPQEWDPAPELSVLADPRNLSRYLVNTFVGRNYPYLTPLEANPHEE